MKQQQSVRELWAYYRKYVLPMDASDVYVQEVEAAFYAGAYALMLELMETSAGTSSHKALVGRFMTLLFELERYSLPHGRTVA